MNDDVQNIPFIAYEAGMVRMERTNRRMFVIVVVTITLLFITNALWLYAWMQYDYSSEETTTTYQQDGEGYNNINTGTQGDVDNGANSDNTEKAKN